MTTTELVADASAVVLAVIDRTRRGEETLARLQSATVHAPALSDAPC